MQRQGPDTMPPKLKPDEWKAIYALRDDLDDEGRTIMRRLIKHCEHLEQHLRSLTLRLRRYNQGDE